MVDVGNGVVEGMIEVVDEGGLGMVCWSGGE